ncbi:hypothetical protein, partial [Xanthovirga aplysinae]|uniref:hypothetical protein n=1 Tax=Xanthovirga aplysinae TaxID=2529853 RepID=UPI001CA3A117
FRSKSIYFRIQVGSDSPHRQSRGFSHMGRKKFLKNVGILNTKPNEKRNPKSKRTKGNPGEPAWFSGEKPA